jgi:hypothetical protein
MAYLSGYSYRKSLSLSRASGAVTDYQMKIIIHRTTGSDSGLDVYIDTKCLESYNDIRFTKSDGTTLLDYWIESSDSSSATIWIEFDSIGTGATTFYLYYGKSGASAVSSGANTFPFFDDFSGDTLNATNWPSSSGAVVSGGKVTLDAESDDQAGAEDYILSNYTMLFEHSMRVKCKASSTTKRFRFGLVSERTTFYLNNIYYIGIQSHITGYRYFDVNHNYNLSQYQVDASDVSLNIWDFEWSNNPPATPRATALLNGSSWYYTESNVPWSGDVIKPFFRDCGEVEWVFVRKKYLVNEPAWGSWGSEEELSIEETILQLKLNISDAWKAFLSGKMQKSGSWKNVLLMKKVSSGSWKGISEG